MASIFKTGILLLGVTLFSACDKNDNKNEDKPDNTPGPLLRSIEWDYGLKGEFNYNSDSTLKNIEYTFENVGGSTIYGWAGKTLTEIYDDRSMYKNVYNYRQDGKLNFIMNTVKTGTSSTAYTLEFAYNSAGKVDSMKYYTINEAGKQLKTSTSYHYHSNGELHEILTDNNNIKILHTIEQYSTPVKFNPYIYISASLDEHYAVYNFPVMKQLEKLPAKLVRKITEPGKPTYTEKIEEVDFMITDFRIDSTVTKLTFPGIPGNNKSIKAIYKYQ